VAVRVVGDPMFLLHRARLAALAIEFQLPTSFFARAHVEAGGLMSYAPDSARMYRQAATYVDKILKGAKPADLPIEQPRPRKPSASRSRRRCCCGRIR
jgi:putative ABC transport system substrate-binding protein